MSKHLKTFIDENRAAFDHAAPPDDLWGRIATELDQQGGTPVIDTKQRHWFGRLLRVAAITFLIGTAGILVFFYGKKSGYDDYSRINPILAAQQQAYAQMVLQKKDSLAFIAASDPALNTEFLNALRQMEMNYESLQQGLAQSPNKTLTLEAMISNLEAQMEVISQQMEVLHYISRTQKEPEHEQI